MKSLLKFSLLSALIISGKLVKQPVPTAVAQTINPNALSDSSVVLVHQMLPVKLVKALRAQAPLPQSGSGLLAGLF